MALGKMAAACAAVVLGARPAIADDSALNREGFWTVGRGDAESKSCMASIASDDAMLLLQVAPDHRDIVVGRQKPMRRGKGGVLSIDGDTFDFEPAYNDKRDFLFFEDPAGRAITAMRQAHSVTVQVDGREVLNIGLDGTGLEGVLDAVVACSQGKSGWWGPGVGAERLSDGPVPNKAANPPVPHKDGVWSVAVGGDPGVCVAQAAVGDDRHLQILAAVGQLGLAVGSRGADLPRGRKGRLEADDYTWEFKPEYGADSYMASAEPFNDDALSALHRAKSLRISVDGRPLVDASLDSSGLADVLDSVAACSRGERGWWGAGAKR